MKKLILLSVLWMMILGVNAQEKEEKKVKPIQLSLAYPIGTAGVKSMDYSNRISLNMTYGVNGGVNGLEIGGVANINKGSVHGAQLSGSVNVNTESSHGLLMAGVANVTLQDASGIQLSGSVNYSGDTKGLMMSGAINQSKAIRGAQLSALLNIAEDVKGGQFSGLMNIAKNVKGIQFAPIINIADTSDYSIALINIVKCGEKGIGLTVDETNNLMVSFRSGGRVMYGIVGVGYNLDNEDANFAMEGGFGANMYKGRYFKLKAEAVTTSLSDWDDYNYFKSSFRLLPTVSIGAMDLMAGPTFNFVHTEFASGSELMDSYLWEDVNDGNFNGLYVGFVGGVNFRF